MRTPTDKAANAPVFEIDPAFGEMAVAMGEATWSIRELTQREKSFACIAADVCARDLGLPFEMHIQMALANDVSASDVREAIIQSAIEAGHTGTLSALARFKDICHNLGVMPPQEGERDLPHGASFDYFAGTEIKDRDFVRQWEPLLRTHWLRPGLSPKERIYISLVGNVLTSTLGPPFEHSVRLAQGQGATNFQLRALVRFLSEYGFSRSWAALDALATLL